MTTEVEQSKLNIHVLTQNQYEELPSVSNTELYIVDPQFQGQKFLGTDEEGEIVEKDALQGVQVNGTDLTIDSNSKVNIDLTDYETKATIQTLSAIDSITLTDNYCYQGGEQTSLTIALPDSATVGFISQITFKSGTTPTAITVPQTGFVWDKRGEDVSGGVFTAVANRNYTFIIGYNGFEFVCYSSGV